MSPEQKPTKPLDIYVRVSRVNGRDVTAEGGTAAEQEKRCRATIEGKGLTVGEVFQDLDVSGGKESRPGWDALMAKIDRGESGGIVAMNLSRLGRHARVEQVILDLESKGAAVILTDGEFDTSSSNGRLILGLLSRVNQYYREMMGEQHDARQRARALAGKPHGAVAVGYAKDADGRYVPNGDADAIREAFRLKATGGTLRQVADYLTSAGVPTQSGKPWSSAGVSQLLENPTYLGQVRYADIVVDDAHEALVDGATFRVANVKQDREYTRRSDGPVLGDGLLTCGTCGSAMVLGRGGKDAQQLSWRCSSTNRQPGERHPTIVDHVVNPFVLLEADRRIVAWMKAEPAPERIADVDDTTLEALALAKADVEALDAALDSGDLSPAVYAKAAQKAAEQVEALEAKIAGAEGERVIYTREQQEAVDAYEFIRDWIYESPYLPDGVDPAAVRRLRRVLRRFLGTVVIQPGRGPVEERVTFVETEVPS